MKNFTYIILILICSLTSAQMRFTLGDNISYDSKNEKDIRLILADDYNQYLFSVINEDGMKAIHDKNIIIRKLDQKGSLIDTYIKDYENKSIGVLHNYLGSTEVGKDQMVIYTEEIDAKKKRKEIFQHVFHKKDGSFNTTSIVKYPIESGMKQGTTFLSFSENGKYVSISNDKSINKKTPNVIENLVIYLPTYEKKWEKSITLDNDLMETQFAVTNSGKIVFIREAAGWKIFSKLIYLSEQEQKDIPLPEKLILKTLQPFSLNDKDYLISFGHYTGPRMNQSDYGDLAFINLENNEIKMNNVPEYRHETKISDIKINLIQQKNGKIYLYNYPVLSTIPQSTSLNRFPDPIISYGNGVWTTIDKEGNAESKASLIEGQYGFATKNGINYSMEPNRIMKTKVGEMTISDKININNGEYYFTKIFLNGVKYIPDADKTIILTNRNNNLNIINIYKIGE